MEDVKEEIKEEELQREKFEENILKIIEQSNNEILENLN